MTDDAGGHAGGGGRGTRRVVLNRGQSVRLATAEGEVEICIARDKDARDNFADYVELLIESPGPIDVATGNMPRRAGRRER